MINKRKIVVLVLFLIALIMCSLIVYIYSEKLESLENVSGSFKSQLAEAEATNAELLKENADLKSSLDAYQNKSLSDRRPPEIRSIEVTDLNGNSVFDGTWATVPKDGKIQFEFELADECTQIDLYYTPTGTGTYIMQKMIGFISVAPDQDRVSYVWEVPKGTMCHVWAIAYNGNVGRISETINVYYE